MPAGRLSLVIFVSLLALLALASLRWALPRPDHPGILQGEVREEGRPVKGALVRWKGEARASLTDARGQFRLPQTSGGSSRLAAWKTGYFIGGVDAQREPLVINLRRLPREDDESYAWIDPELSPTRQDSCARCHEEIYDDWWISGHGRSVRTGHFLTMYQGTDWRNTPGRGWSLRDERPDGVGVCTACHAPTVPHDDPAYFDLSKVQGVAGQGVHCDYCHKIADAGLGTIGLTHGRFGIELLRPAEGQLFFGPLDDVDRGEDTFSPLYKESRYCASCHEGTVLGVHVYGTYSEWLESPARRQGKQCQTCHMQPTGKMTNVAPGHGGIERDPSTLANHRFFAGSQLDMLRRALGVSVTSTNEGDECRLIVELRANGVGHRVPTGFADRHLALIVEPLDTNGNRIETLSGPVLPKPAGRDSAGLPGRLYGRLLKDDNGSWPVPFWRADDSQTEDTRLAADQQDRITFTLSAKASRVRIRLLHRRTWPEVAEAKGWPDNEMVVVDRFFDLH